MTPPTPQHDTSHGNRMLLLGLLGGGIAWTLHLLGSYAIAEWGCVQPAPSLLGLRITAWLIIVLTLVTAMMAVGAAWLARHARRQQHETDGDGLAAIALMTSVFFAAIIIFEAAPIAWYLHQC